MWQGRGPYTPPFPPPPFWPIVRHLEHLDVNEEGSSLVASYSYGRHHPPPPFPVSPFGPWPGLVEYLDVNEEGSSLVAMYPADCYIKGVPRPEVRWDTGGKGLQRC